MCLEWCMNCTRFGMHSPPSPSSLYSATWGCYQTNKAELEQRDRANDMVMSKCRWYATFESPVNFVLRFRSCRVRLDFFLVTFFFSTLTTEHTYHREQRWKRHAWCEIVNSGHVQWTPDKKQVSRWSRCGPNVWKQMATVNYFHSPCHHSLGSSVSLGVGYLLLLPYFVFSCIYFW